MADEPEKPADDDQPVPEREQVADRKTGVCPLHGGSWSDCGGPHSRPR